MTTENTSSGFRRDLIASYASQGYVSVVTIFAVPLQAKAVGAEGFGLIGLMAVLQAWFFLLDFGRVAMVTRVSAQALVHASKGFALHIILPSTVRRMGSTALLGALAVLLLSEYAADYWSELKNIDPEQLAMCVRLIGAIVAVRFLSEVYRGTLTGLGHIAWLAGFNAVTGTLKNLAVLPLIAWAGQSEPAVIFFYFQLGIAALECSVLAIVAYGLLRNLRHGSICVDPAGYPATRFAWQMSAAAFLWVLVSQLDKMLLAGMLPLEQFGLFSLVTVLANGILLIAIPFGMLVPVRLTALGGPATEGALRFYRMVSRWAVVAVGAAAAVLVMHGSEVLKLWTGNPVVVAEASALLRYYALGNAVMAIAAFPYYLQFASGNLALHVRGQVLFAVALAPLMFVAVSKFGMTGAGAAWMIINMLYALVWIPLVHSRYSPRLNRHWLVEDVMPPVLGACGGAAVAALVAPPTTRSLLALWVGGAVSLALLGAFFGAHLARRWWGVEPITQDREEDAKA